MYRIWRFLLCTRFQLKAFNISKPCVPLLAIGGFIKYEHPENISIDSSKGTIGDQLLKDILQDEKLTLGPMEQILRKHPHGMQYIPYDIRGEVLDEWRKHYVSNILEKVSQMEETELPLDAFIKCIGSAQLYSVLPVRNIFQIPFNRIYVRSTEKNPVFATWDRAIVESRCISRSGEKKVSNCYLDVIMLDDASKNDKIIVHGDYFEIISDQQLKVSKKHVLYCELLMHLGQINEARNRDIIKDANFESEKRKNRLAEQSEFAFF